MDGKLGVGVRMEQLRRFFNLRNVLISETHAPVRACVGAIMCTNVPVYVRIRACVRIMHVHACVPLRGRAIFSRFLVSDRVGLSTTTHHEQTT